MSPSLHTNFSLESLPAPLPRVVDGDARDTAATAWRAFAPLIAGDKRVRLSRDGGKSYPERHVRTLTEALPSVPAAVAITGRDGMVATLCLDLDVSRGDVQRDAGSIKQFLGNCGLRWIEDDSPSGGIHIYVPLVQRVDFTGARIVVEALSRRFPTIDPGPHQSAKTGCIRVPGSPWKKGGHQRLTQPFGEAYDVARRRNPAAAYDALRSQLRDDINAQRAERAPLAAATPGHAPQGAVLRAEAERIARHGLFDSGKYRSPSEARQAVLAAAAGKGWTLTDVQQRMLTGTWPGLAALYAKYTAASRARTLSREWHRATDYCEKQQTLNGGRNALRKNDTSQPITQGGPRGLASEHEFLRSWETGLRVFERARLHNTREGIGQRLLLRALLEAAHKKGSRFVEFGIRAYAVATATHPATVAKQLRALSTVGPTGLIRLAGEGRGKNADLYELRIPDELQAVTEESSWRAGRIHALRPVFRELGPVAALVYEALERSNGPLDSLQAADDAGLSPTSTHEALETLAAWNLIERGPAGWTVVESTSLRALADYFGVLEDVAAQLAQYRRQRATWHAWLDDRMNTFGSLAMLSDDYEYSDDDIPLWPDEYGDHASLAVIAV